MGLASATSASERITVSGLRSSWLAFATKRRWESKDCSSRSSMSSKVRASSLQLVLRTGQRDALVEALLGDPPSRAVMRSIGASARPATAQPATIASSTVPANASTYCKPS